MNFKLIFFQELNWRTCALNNREGDFGPCWSLVLLSWFWSGRSINILTPRFACVCSPEAASLVLSINPAKLIMLLRGRWHHCEVSATACQGSLCPYLNFHPMWILWTSSAAHSSANFLCSRRCWGKIAMVAQTCIQQREGLEVHCRLWQISLHSCSMRAGNLLSQVHAGYKKITVSPPQAPAPSLRGMPAGKQIHRWSGSKERINLSAGARRKYGRLPVPTSSCPSAPQSLIVQNYKYMAELLPGKPEISWEIHASRAAAVDVILRAWWLFSP